MKPNRLIIIRDIYKIIKELWFRNEINVGVKAKVELKLASEIFKNREYS